MKFHWLYGLTNALVKKELQSISDEKWVSPGLLLPKHLALVAQRGGAGPAFECAVEGAKLRIAEQESDLGKRIFAVLEVAHGKTLAGVFNQLLEVKAIFLESPLERTRTHRHLFRDPG
jgi:hypothetical protein